MSEKETRTSMQLAWILKTKRPCMRPLIFILNPMFLKETTSINANSTIEKLVLREEPTSKTSLTQLSFILKGLNLIIAQCRDIKSMITVSSLRESISKNGLKRELKSK